MIQPSAHRTTFPLRLVLLAGGLLAALAGAAVADPLALSRQTCTTLNCGALTLPGVINGHPTIPATATQWVGQFSGQASSCLRFQVTSTSPTRDLAMSVVAPDGTVFTNNNGGVAGCANCPKVVVGAAKNGFYTVVVAHAGALPAAETNFTLRAGLYNSRNAPNCNGPTTGR
jgi:hypothetical protein